MSGSQVGLIIGTLLAASVSAQADTVQVGFIIFQQTEEANPPQAGANGFNINNFTGPFASPPDFTASSALIFKNVSLTLAGDVSGTVPLSDIGPGSVTPPAATFPDTDNFTSATFDASLSAQNFQVTDGVNFFNFHADSTAVEAVISPGFGPDLTPLTPTGENFDFAVITVSGEIIPPNGTVPEPASYWLLFTSLVLVGARWKLKQYSLETTILKGRFKPNRTAADLFSFR